jgi:hypothetical protein
VATGLAHFEDVAVYDGKTKRCRMDGCVIDCDLSDPGSRNVGFVSNGDGDFGDTPLLVSTLHTKALLDVTRMNRRAVKMRVNIVWDSQNDGASGIVGVKDIYMLNR